ncbi:MAG: NifB/NifX family molybdenum-iron cluster-binding protein [Spirochaetales bacterium]|nr:NifB/NifX family molybdenum-iron cluster-binding protein [Spirochaetales bacterium]
MSAVMKVAFPTNDRINVEEHFGHAKEFAFAVVKDGKVETTDYIVPPPHAPGVIPEFVKKQGATAIVTGGMGGMAVQIFKDNDIEVILGARGTIEECLKVYMEGNLESTGSVCDHHH